MRAPQGPGQGQGQGLGQGWQQAGQAGAPTSQARAAQEGQGQGLQASGAAGQAASEHAAASAAAAAGNESGQWEYLDPQGVVQVGRQGSPSRAARARRPFCSEACACEPFVDRHMVLWSATCLPQGGAGH